MTLGVGTYHPSGLFAFPRSYIEGIAINVTTPAIFHDGRHYWFRDGTNVNRFYHFWLKANFYEWNSNCYTLNYLVEQSYYVTNPNPAQTPMPFTCLWRYPPGEQAPWINLQPFGINFLNFHNYPLPPAPPDYWKPNWL